MIDDRLSLSITMPDGRITRWGPDEPDGKDIPNDLAFTDTIPGGHATLTTSLLRRIDVTHNDEQLFADVHCYGAGGRTGWRGRLQQFPRTHGEGYGVSPGAVGYSAHLRDDPSFREVFLDRDTSAWTEAPLERRVERANAGFPQGKVPVSISGGITWLPPNEALPNTETTEVVYDAGPGITCAALLYAGTRTGASWAGSFEAPTVFVDTAITFPSAQTAALTLDGAARTASGWTPERYLLLRSRVSAAVTPAAGHQQSYTSLGVIGNHGLTTSTAGTGSTGFLASDVIAYIVANAAPLLTYTTGDGGSITTTAFAIPHLVYRDPVTAEDAISDVNKYHQYDWGVYDNREFFYRQPDPYRVLWEARLSDGAHLDADGDTAEQVINGVFVTYTDPTGVQKTVGPPGGSFDNTDTVLEDTSSSNPVNAAGIPRKWVQLTLSFPTTLAGATQIGYVYLQERSLAGRRGRVTLTGSATHPTEGKVPCWRVRAGDWVSLRDLNGATVPRKIIEKSYTHSGRQVVLTLDNTPSALDAILARVGIQAGIATGGGF